MRLQTVYSFLHRSIPLHTFGIHPSVIIGVFDWITNYLEPGQLRPPGVHFFFVHDFSSQNKSLVGVQDGSRLAVWASWLLLIVLTGQLCGSSGLSPYTHKPNWVHSTHTIWWCSKSKSKHMTVSTHKPIADDVRISNDCFYRLANASLKYSLVAFTSKSEYIRRRSCWWGISWVSCVSNPSTSWLWSQKVTKVVHPGRSTSQPSRANDKRSTYVHLTRPSIYRPCHLDLFYPSRQQSSRSRHMPEQCCHVLIRLGQTI